MLIPPPRVESVELHSRRTILVVRDDELPGGSKRRVLPALLAQWPEDEFVYGGPAYGYAQVALAHSAADVGKRATVFVAKRNHPHALSIEAARAGAHIVQVPHGRLSVVRARAREYSATVGARELPFGFDTDDFAGGLAAVAESLVLDPGEVWCVAGSGTLTRALQQAWPHADHHAVRIGARSRLGKATEWCAREEFEDPALEPPPFPSCPNYDAKAWAFVVAHAHDGAVFWNVAG